MTFACNGLFGIRGCVVPFYCDRLIFILLLWTVEKPTSCMYGFVHYRLVNFPIICWRTSNRHIFGAFSSLKFIHLDVRFPKWD